MSKTQIIFHVENCTKTDSGCVHFLHISNFILMDIRIELIWLWFC